jgi:Fic family protein
MEVQERRRGRRLYYYLVHSYRWKGTIRKREWYLGTRLPADLARIKATRRIELLTDQWEPALDRVGRDFRADRRRTPAPVIAKELESFAVRFTYDTNRIEGSTLTFRESAALLRDGVTPGGRPISDVQEALAHRRVFLDALQRERSLDRDSLLRWHRALFTQTKPQIAGRIREYSVTIGGSRFTPPLPFELDLLLDAFFRWYRDEGRGVHPVIRAALVHYRLVTVHPFGDGNGRVTRLAMNFVLYRNRFPMFDIPYSDRTSYHRALELAQLAADEGVFARWFLRRYVRIHAQWGGAETGGPGRRGRRSTQ